MAHYYTLSILRFPSVVFIALFTVATCSLTGLMTTCSIAYHEKNLHIIIQPIGCLNHSLRKAFRVEQKSQISIHTVSLTTFHKQHEDELKIPSVRDASATGTARVMHQLCSIHSYELNNWIAGYFFLHVMRCNLFVMCKYNNLMLQLLKNIAVCLSVHAYQLTTYYSSPTKLCFQSWLWLTLILISRTTIQVWYPS